MLTRLDLRGTGTDVGDRLPRPDLGGSAPVEAVREILAEVKKRGDGALREYTERFDGVRVDRLSIGPTALDEALAATPPLLREALGEARAGGGEGARWGGAQAVAALAYGTESIRPVDVIVGPGNVYVATAKREVGAEGAVGLPAAFAGPSEVVVVADETTPPEYAAIDLVVQAEHGPDGLAWLITWSPDTADAVTDAVSR